MNTEDQLQFDADSSDSQSTSSSSMVVIKNQDNYSENKKKDDYNPLLSAYIPYIDDVQIFDLDIETLDNKPWQRPGADIEDYFNYGFDEKSWKMYCAKQRVLREENGKLMYRVRRTDKKNEERVGNERVNNKFDRRDDQKDKNNANFRKDEQNNVNYRNERNYTQKYNESDRNEDVFRRNERHGRNDINREYGVDERVYREGYRRGEYDYTHPSNNRRDNDQRRREYEDNYRRQYDQRDDRTRRDFERRR